MTQRVVVRHIWFATKEPPHETLCVGDLWDGLVWMGKHWTAAIEVEDSE